MPKVFKNAMVYLRKFVAIDEVYCISCYQFVLFVITSLDREEKILVLAWALIPARNQPN